MNLAVTLYRPDGQECGAFKSNYYGSLRISHYAEATGLYHLKVSSLETQAISRRFDLLVEELRSASLQDQRDNEATRNFYEAERLRTEWIKASTETAIEKYAAALATWLSAERPVQTIEAYLRIGDAYFALSNYPESLSYYERALDLSRANAQSTSEAIALNSIGYLYIRTGKERDAHTYFQKVAAMYSNSDATDRSPQSRRAEAQALCNLGEIYYSLGELGRALEYFERALNIWTEIGDRGGQALARLDLGYAVSDTGDPFKATGEFEQALSLWREIGDRNGEAFALMGLGANHTFFKRVDPARECQRQALELFRITGNRHGEAVALNGVARIYEDLNELQTALDNYFQALDTYQRNNTQEFAASTEYSIARVYRWMGQTDSAMNHYNECIKISQSIGKRRVEAYALMDIATLQIAMGKTQKGYDQYKQILQLYRKIGDRRGQAKVINSIGDIHNSAGEERQALKHYRQALLLYQQSKDSNGEAFTLYTMAQAARASGDNAAAVSHLGSAIKITEVLRVQIASPTLRSSYFSSVRKYHALYIDSLMQLHDKQPGKGFAVAAFEASERARARVLLEALSESAANIRQGVRPDLLERERHLQQLLSTKASYQSRLLSNTEVRKESEEVAQEIRQLSTEYQEVQAQIRQNSPRYANLTQPQPFGLADIQQVLGNENTLLLEYVLGEPRSYLWAITQNSVDGFELSGRTVLENEARNAYNSLIARQPVPGETENDRRARVAAADAQFVQSSRNLSRELLGPVAALLRNKRLLIVADGALQYVPFEALPVHSLDPPETEKTNSEAFIPMVQDHEIVNLPSASTLIALRRDSESQPLASGLVAVLADPVFELDDPRVRKHAGLSVNGEVRGGSEFLRKALKDGSRSSGASRLPYTRQEADDIASIAPDGTSIFAVGFKANRTTANSPQLGQYQIVHFATHGIANDKYPELSGIILSLVDEQGRPEEGFLQLHDIYNLNLSATLVVLSACDTGLGKDVNGEGLVGMTRGFMYAGSKSVMASLWKVNDRATAELMKHFYKRMLNDGLRPAEALRAAKLEMLKEGQWQAPYYWAGFVLQGDYTQGITVNLTKKNSWGVGRLPIILLAILVGGCLVAGLIRMGSRLKRQ